MFIQIPYYQWADPALVHTLLLDEESEEEDGKGSKKFPSFMCILSKKKKMPGIKKFHKLY